MFLTVEGLDGSGGTTLVERIENEYDNVVTTAEPSEQWTGKQVRRCLSDETTDPLTDFYFFMGDRINHIEETIRPNDNDDTLVVSDRYAASTRAYQPIALAEGDRFDSQTQAKIFIEQAMKPWSYKPDLTFYLDVSVETSLQRSDGDEKYEEREFLEQVKENYEAVIDANPDRFVVIDAEQSKEGVAETALSELDRRF